jgi:hypothetical protein
MSAPKNFWEQNTEKLQTHSSPLLLISFSVYDRIWPRQVDNMPSTLDSERQAATAVLQRAQEDAAHAEGMADFVWLRAVLGPAVVLRGRTGRLPAWLEIE